jgi:hypothetical protein
MTAPGLETLGITDWLRRLRWLDRTPLLPLVEPYRLELLERANARDVGGRLLRNLILSGRGKKNAKTLDAVLDALYVVGGTSPGGSQVYIVTNDLGQSADDLDLAKKIIKANPILGDFLKVNKNIISRRDGEGFIEILPAQDAIGQHGKTYRLLVVDEIHGYRNYDLLEALAPDPTRDDVQQWITSYASIFHRPGVPLFDLQAMAKCGDDPRLLFSWYAADYCTDPALATATPEERANPSMGSWRNPHYLAQQQRRLPAHKYRRLHLNLPGLPEGSAFQPEPVMDAIDRGVSVRPPDKALSYAAFVDMSGGSADAAVLAIGHRDPDDRVVLDAVVDQGQRPPFDPNAAVTRFVKVLNSYRVTRVVGDRYAGETFKRQFETQGIAYEVCQDSKHELYEALEPRLNSRGVVLLDVPQLEQQLLGLVWRGGRIDHPAGEHDDYANAAAGLVRLVSAGATMSTEQMLAVLDVGKGSGDGADWHDEVGRNFDFFRNTDL